LVGYGSTYWQFKFTFHPKPVAFCIDFKKPEAAFFINSKIKGTENLLYNYYVPHDFISKFIRQFTLFHLQVTLSPSKIYLSQCPTAH
jgi:hypothetical protein